MYGRKGRIPCLSGIITGRMSCSWPGGGGEQDRHAPAALVFCIQAWQILYVLARCQHFRQAGGPMNFQEQWRKLLLPLRYGGSGVDFKKLDPARSPFLKDRDRIIYSSSFRRLARKTQVHPLVRNDHIHTRLSHSLEVSSVGRSLGAMAGYFLRRRGELPDYAAPEFPGQILEAACLAHDIGNPPFGHAGEFAIRDWFGDPANHTYVNALEETQQSDFRCFDGNAQGFRVVNVVENNRDQGGFRLTYPTLASMVKYPWDSWQSRARGGKCKFNYYQAEAAIFEDVFRALGLKTRRGDFARHPLSLLAEAADDTCYRIVDMEDARELDIITLADILKVVEPLAPQDDGKYMAINVDFDSLHDVNPEIYAWIEVPGTNINYAVVQSAADDLFYDDHGVDRSYYSGGSIFSQRYNTTTFQDPVTVLYGHNRQSQTMFAQVNNFADAEFFAKNQKIIVYTPDKVYEYTIFAAYPHSSEHLLLCHDFTDPQQFADYFASLGEAINANYRRDLFPQAGDRVLTLSTCYRQNRMQRFLVQGVLTETYDVIK